jgi:hypothetical protein
MRRLAALGMGMGLVGCAQPLTDWCLYSYSEAGIAAMDSEFTCELRPLDEPIPSGVEECGAFYLLPESNNFASNVKYDRYYAIDDLSLMAVMAFIDRDVPSWYGRQVNCESFCSFGDDPTLPLCEETP